MNLEEYVDRLKQQTEQANNRLLKTFEFVPDDKLEWSPSETARTPLWIAAHCGVANSAFATVLRGEKLELPNDPKEASARIRQGGKDVRTRKEAVKLVEDGTAQVLEALGKVTPDMAESRPMSPMGPIPFTVWMELPASHMIGHAQQIDYIQTIWGDLDNHM